MTQALFREKLAGRFATMNAEVLGDILDLSGGWSDQGRAVVWKEFIDSWSVNYAPNRATFLKLAESQGIRPESAPKAKVWMYVCYVCTAKTSQTVKYATDNAKCPYCSNRDRALYALIDPHASVPQERAQRLVDRYPAGVHDKYGRPDKKGSLAMTPALSSALAPDEPEKPRLPYADQGDYD